MAEARIEELPKRVARGLDPVYLLAGEEPLLIEEALDGLRAQARAAGFAEREVLHVETGFSWSRLGEVADNLSLFSERRIIELRMPNGKPGREGASALRDYASAPPEDTLLIVICGRLDPAQRKSAWAAALAGAGVMSYAWPVPREALPRWIAERARQRGVSLEREAVAVIAERNEGNLLALAQEIDKLALLADGKAMSGAQARDAVSDSARFAIFDLPEAVLAGDLPRTRRIARRLRAEGEEPVLVLWGLAREIRVLTDLQAAQRPGGDRQAVLRRHRVWKNRQARLQQLAQEAPREAWAKLLSRAAAADRVLKGAERRRPWDELIELACDAARLAGHGKQPEDLTWQ
ncbi:MAG: DNA polymerase III subunit delta [Spiribacter sp.]|nr:DNA polymerase III subunit delta [Spiribacter sp.]